MADKRHKIVIPEVCRVEGHEAVYVDVEGDKVTNVELQVFEGTRFFERIVLNHPAIEMPHITSRVCAICSTGHVLASIRALEDLAGFTPNRCVASFRELMHLGMVIESNATHIYALALPDFLGFADVHEFAVEHSEQFQNWTELRSLGSRIQSTVGGRPFHPVNLHAGGLSSYPTPEQLQTIASELREKRQLALNTCQTLSGFEPPVARTSKPVFLALIPEEEHYGYFGTRVKASTGFEGDVKDYQSYLEEKTVAHSHSKRSTFEGEPLMVGSMARLHLFGDRLGSRARSIYESSTMAAGDTNSIWNNLAQAIEIVEAFDCCEAIIETLLADKDEWSSFEGRKQSRSEITIGSGRSVGAVECPRGTLYHCYDVNDWGVISGADMITPSAQNTYRIERDIEEVVGQCIAEVSDQSRQERLRTNLETLIRAYDPCNTCATHMVKVSYKAEGDS